MKKYARMFEFTKAAKLEFERELGALFTPLGMHDTEIKNKFLKFVGVLGLGGEEVILGTKVENNGGRTYVVIADKQLDEEWVEVEYRYKPQKGHELADWLFYLEDLVAAYDVPRTLIEGEEDEQFN